MLKQAIMSKHVWVVLCFLVMISGCASYYRTDLKFQQQFANGEIEQAAETLAGNEKAADGKDRLLYFLNKGVVEQMLGQYEESNASFEEAYLFTEDVQTNYAEEAFSFLSNPMILPYKGEDFEVVLLHYYKAFNYLRLRQYDNALVECRRINIILQELNDKHGDRKNRYRQDAFALNLMGMIFEAAGEDNNAFISYRNAYETYRDDYAPRYGVGAPHQLKKDLLRTAYRMGFTEERLQYEEEFGFTYQPEERTGGELVFFWLNGLGPVKEEWGITFFIVKGKDGLISFVNEDMGLSFPFYPGSYKEGPVDLGDLKFIRITFPKYVERPPFFTRASLEAGGKRYDLEMAENINAIAFTTLEDRMLREFGKSLLRFAIKQAAEQGLRKQNEGLGAILSLVNAATEKTDTRNWQTLPYSISYTRVPLKEGMNSIELVSSSGAHRETYSLEFDVNAGKNETVFDMFHSLESGFQGVR